MAQKARRQKSEITCRGMAYLRGESSSLLACPEMNKLENRACEVNRHVCAGDEIRRPRRNSEIPEIWPIYGTRGNLEVHMSGSL